MDYKQYLRKQKDHTHQNWCACTWHQGLHAWIFWVNSDWLHFLTPMDYSPWSEREFWPFLRVAISLKAKRPHPPKLVCMHLISGPTCMNFSADSNWLNFLMTMDYIWPFLKVAISPKLEKPHPPKLVSWHQSLLAWIFWADFEWLNFLTTMDCRKGNLAIFESSISPKPERPRPQKLVCMHLTSRPTCCQYFMHMNDRSL